MTARTHGRMRRLNGRKGRRGCGSRRCAASSGQQIQVEAAQPVGLDALGDGRHLRRREAPATLSKSGGRPHPWQGSARAPLEPAERLARSDSGRKIMTTYRVGYFVGSLSSTSINRELANVLIRLAPQDLTFIEIPIGNLPLYSPDHDANYPPEATSLKQAIRESDAVLSVTPEYNRSIPGALKNA